MQKKKSEFIDVIRQKLHKSGDGFAVSFASVRSNPNEQCNSSSVVDNRTSVTLLGRDRSNRRILFS